MLSNGVTMLSQHLECIMLYIHQYSVHILYKAGIELYIAHWLSHHNCVENQDQEIAGMNASIHTINTAVDMPICMSVDDVKSATEEDMLLHMLKKGVYIATYQGGTRAAGRKILVDKT